MENNTAKPESAARSYWHGRDDAFNRMIYVVMLIGAIAILTIIWVFSTRVTIIGRDGWRCRTTEYVYTLRGQKYLESVCGIPYPPASSPEELKNDQKTPQNASE